VGKIIDIAGRRFGRLVVLGFAGLKGRRSLWKCKCDCGITKTIVKTSLMSNHSKSCGCLNDELRRKRSGKNCPSYKHGDSRSHLYKTWAAMIKRCYNSNSIHYSLYGARGVIVCWEWHNDNPEGFLNFKKWALENGYKEELQIDKDKIKPGNKVYCPEYCSFITRREQCNNRRSNHNIIVEGMTMTITEAARKYGIKPVTARARITRYGWSVEETFLNK
jgi:hypothetical protein